MSDKQGQPFEVIGDEAREARIVAWVLGEASEGAGSRSKLRLSDPSFSRRTTLENPASFIRPMCRRR